MNRLQRVTSELSELQAILERCVGEGDTVPDDAPGIIDDAVDLLQDLRKAMTEEPT